MQNKVKEGSTLKFVFSLKHCYYTILNAFKHKYTLTLNSLLLFVQA